MFKEINKRRYDTEKARLIGSMTADYGLADVHYYEEKLYRKRTGEFFVYGKGNAASIYNHEIPGGGAFTGGEMIIPLIVEAAMEWVNIYMEDIEKGMWEWLFPNVKYENRFPKESEPESTEIYHYKWDAYCI